MTRIFTDDMEPLRFHILLDGGRNVTRFITRAHHGDTHIQCLFCDFDQLCCQRGDFPNASCKSRVTYESLQNRPTVHRNYIAFLEFATIRDTVNQLLVNTYANGGREWGGTIVSKRRISTMFLQNILSSRVEVAVVTPGCKSSRTPANTLAFKRPASLIRAISAAFLMIISRSQVIPAS